ncbi:MAG: CHAT domain-containing protein [Acidobacteria bacterium]|nr:CHAT domain-containing protein [Acidobacteriota bacterium]
MAARQAALAGDRLFDQETREARRAASQQYETALALYRALGEREQEATMLYNLGYVARALGEMPQAQSFYQQALALQRGGADRGAEAATLSDLGEVHLSMGEMVSAKNYLDQALVLRKQVGDKNGEAITLNDLGVVARVAGEYEKAREYYEQVLPLRRELGDKLGEGVTLHNLATIYQVLGDLPKAQELLRQAIALMRLAGDRHGEANSLKNLGDVYRELGDWQQARTHYEQALALKRLVGDKRGEAIALSHVGSAYRALGDLQKALAYQQQALQLSQESGDKLSEAGVLNNLGAVYESLGDTSRAVQQYEQGLALLREVGEKRREADVLKNIAEIRRAQGQLSEARTLIEQALTLLELIRAAAGSENERAAFLATVLDFYEFQTDLLMQLDKRAPQNGHAQQALESSEQARARSLLETLHEARADLRQGVPAALLAREQSLRQRLTAGLDQLSRLLKGKYTAAQKTAAEQALEALLAEQRRLQAELKQASPQYAALTQPQPLSSAEIQTQLLDDETLLLEYALGEKRSYLWLVSTAAVSAYELPPRAEIEAAARQVYALLTARQPQPDETEAARRARLAAAETAFSTQAGALSRMLLGPVAAQLGRRRLAIVAAGALAYLPFAALPDPAAPDPAAANAGQPLLAAHEIINLPSAAVLAVMRRELAGRPAAARTVAVWADPVFEANDPRVLVARKNLPARPGPAKPAGPAPPAPADLAADLARAVRAFTLPANGTSSARSGLTRLPFSREEAAAIGALAPAGQVLQATGFQASRARLLKEDLGQYRFIHFATHGLLNAEHPELSGLVFSLVNEAGQPQDGFLRLHEIFNLRLSAEVVVLSACQTALGKEVRGEGLIGLTRGFMYAGAPRVVASLWQVDDLATAELMKRFYSGMLKQGLRPAAALRAAQLELLGQKRYAAPFYWAAFTLQGDWR